MIYVGIDDTDTLDDPGTNQLARHLIRELAGRYTGQMILRHQLLEDPRVPCTKKNGCASILFEPVSKIKMPDRSPPLGGEGPGEGGLRELTLLIHSLRELILPWCPTGSDPGFCVAAIVPPAIIEWGLRCKRELVTQAEARELALQHNIHLEGLGGTEDGIIGALAAIGLIATRNDGRVVYFESQGADWYDVTGCLDVHDILGRGVNEVLDSQSGKPVTAGVVDVGKRLRPNFRHGRIVLYVTRNATPHWEAVRVT
jgi:tRNA(Ile2) C34 agmatinyltransferase TiaS